jgi:hypothetical protein
MRLHGWGNVDMTWTLANLIIQIFGGVSGGHAIMAAVT